MTWIQVQIHLLQTTAQFLFLYIICRQEKWEKEVSHWRAPHAPWNQFQSFSELGRNKLVFGKIPLRPKTKERCCPMVPDIARTPAFLIVVARLAAAAVTGVFGSISKGSTWGCHPSYSLSQLHYCPKHSSSGTWECRCSYSCNETMQYVKECFQLVCFLHECIFLLVFHKQILDKRGEGLLILH